MRIRRFREEDAAAVSELIRETLRIANAQDYPAEMIEELIAHEQTEDVLARARSSHFYVALEDEKTVGCGAVSPHPRKQDVCCLYNLFVLPQYQGRGIGCMIEETLEKDEYALLAKRIELRASITGLPFYQKLGYSFMEGQDKPDEELLYGMEKTMNPGLNLIFSRHSYRGRYKPEKVPREHLKTIMEAGLAAPSGCNRQTVSLIAADDPEVLAKLRAAIDPPVAESAPAMICVLTQRIIAYRDRCFATQDYAAAIENILLAVKALGYESCWYEGHITDADRIGSRLAAILGVPDEYELVCVLPVGKAEDDITGPEKKRFEERAWFNGFGK